MKKGDMTTVNDGNDEYAAMVVAVNDDTCDLVVFQADRENPVTLFKAIPSADDANGTPFYGSKSKGKK